MPRKPPKPHKVYPKHPRYHVHTYKRGHREEFEGHELSSYYDPAVYYPAQTMRDFQEGDQVAFWEPTDRGIFLSKGWTITGIYPTGVVLMRNPKVMGGGDIKFWNGEGLAKTMVLVKRKEIEGADSVRGKTYTKAENRAKLMREIRETYGDQKVDLLEYNFLEDQGVVVELLRTPRLYREGVPSGSPKYLYETRVLDLSTREEVARNNWNKTKAYEHYRNLIQQ